MSSTKIRLFLEKDMSIRCKYHVTRFQLPKSLISTSIVLPGKLFELRDTDNIRIQDLIPTSVINFIYEHELFNVKTPANGHERTSSGSKKVLLNAQVDGIHGGENSVQSSK